MHDNLTSRNDLNIIPDFNMAHKSVWHESAGVGEFVFLNSSNILGSLLN